MASKVNPINVDLNSIFEGAVSQFRSLNPNEPGQWPMLPKILTWGLVAAIMIVLGWFTLLSTAHDDLEAERMGLLDTGLDLVDGRAQLDVKTLRAKVARFKPPPL